MALELTDAAKQASQQLNVKPNIVFDIAGYSRRFGVSEIKKLIRIGDPGLVIGDDWLIGGYRLIDNQAAYISFNTGTTTRITQALSPDRGQGSSVSQLIVSLIDKNEEISSLVAPGKELQDIMNRDATVSIGFVETDIDQDYNVIFRGVISDLECGPGYINFILTNTEEKKRKPITQRDTGKLTADIADSGAVTTLSLVSTTMFYQDILGPDGLNDDSIEYYAKIGDEIFKYTGISGNTLTGVTRAQFGTAMAAHEIDDEVVSFIRLQGVGLTLALKLMLSGWGGYYDSQAATNFVTLDSLNDVPNAIFFNGINVAEKYGLVEGDYITTSGASNGANNVTLKQIQDIDVTEDGSYLVIADVNFVIELNTSATVQFRSQFDTLPVGLKMKPSEVDVKQHVKIRDRYLSVFEFDFFTSDISAGKEFLERQVYLPQACFSVPRKGRSSVSLHVGPLSEDELVTLDLSNVLNADKLKVRRSISKNFANTIVYSYNKNKATEEFATVKEYRDDDAIAQIGIGKKSIDINAEGMTTALSAEARSEQSANRLLQRYKLGAEYIQGIQVQFGSGYGVEIGDIIAVNYAALQLTDFQTGTRMGDIKLMEVLNKILDQKTGEVSLDVVNTIFDNTDRLGLISPGSKLDVGCTTQKLVLKKSWSTKPFQKESKKWRRYIGEDIVVHSPDWTFSHRVTISALGLDGQTMIVVPPLPSAPLENYIIQIPAYTGDINDLYVYKARYAFFSPQLQVTSGTSQTVFNVSVGDAARILVGAILRVHNFDFSSDSPEVVVTDKTGTQITVDTPLGFTPNSTYLIDLVGFLDGGFAYRYI